VPPGSIGCPSACTIKQPLGRGFPISIVLCSSPGIACSTRISFQYVFSTQDTGSAVHALNFRPQLLLCRPCEFPKGEAGALVRGRLLCPCYSEPLLAAPPRAVMWNLNDKKGSRWFRDYPLGSVLFGLDIANTYRFSSLGQTGMPHLRLVSICETNGAPWEHVIHRITAVRVPAA
jgi:hypothetical protein